MKYAIMSDIHGNTTGLLTVLSKIKEIGGVDKIIVAGDIVGGSGGTSDMIDILRTNNVDIIRGNMEDFLSDSITNISKVSPKFNDYMNAWYSWLKENLKEADWNMLVQSPLNRTYTFNNNKSMLVCHASPNDPWDRICAEDTPIEVLETSYCNYDNDIFVYGHFHKNHIINHAGKSYVNVASVGIRKDDKCNFSIIEDDNDSVSIKQYSIKYNTNDELQLNNDKSIPIFSDLVK